jgi:hypothetical protein
MGLVCHLAVMGMAGAVVMSDFLSMGMFHGRGNGLVHRLRRFVNGYDRDQREAEVADPVK